MNIDKQSNSQVGNGCKLGPVSPSRMRVSPRWIPSRQTCVLAYVCNFFSLLYSAFFVCINEVPALNSSNFPRKLYQKPDTEEIKH